MNKTTLLLTLTLVSCSHVATQNKVAMELPFVPELVEQMQKSAGRVPASFEVEEIEGKSSRRVYFTALYHQYLSMGHHLGNEVTLNSCPQFHHDKIETDAVSVPEFSIYKTSNLSGTSKEFFPELVFTKKFSLEDYHAEMGQEIATLCEDGVSDNFYKFDNLITHYAGKKSFHSRADSMKSVLKIPVFANYYLLKMLTPAHTVSTVHPEETMVIKMTHTQWFEKYVTEAHRMRSNLIKNRMVQR